VSRSSRFGQCSGFIRTYYIHTTWIQRYLNLKTVLWFIDQMRKFMQCCLKTTSVGSILYQIKPKTFKLGNVQISYDASGEGLLKTVRVTSYGGGGWSNRHITFVVAEKLNSQFSYSIYGIYGEKKSKIAQKNRHMIFERSLSINNIPVLIKNKCKALPRLSRCRQVQPVA